MAVILAFAGNIASGKTTVSREVASTLRWPYASFGDYVRSEAQSQGKDDSREVLQEIGEGLIERGWESFCHGVLARAGWQPGQSVVVDGVRHLEAIQTLQRLVGRSLLALVFIDVNNRERVQRLRHLGISDTEQLARWERHSTEAQVRTELYDLANLILDGTRQPDELVAAVVAFIREFEMTN